MECHALYFEEMARKVLLGAVASSKLRKVLCDNLGQVVPTSYRDSRWDSPKMWKNGNLWLRTNIESISAATPVPFYWLLSPFFSQSDFCHTDGIHMQRRWASAILSIMMQLRAKSTFDLLLLSKKVQKKHHLYTCLGIHRATCQILSRKWFHAILLIAKALQLRAVLLFVRSVPSHFWTQYVPFWTCDPLLSREGNSPSLFIFLQPWIYLLDFFLFWRGQGVGVGSLLMMLIIENQLMGTISIGSRRWKQLIIGTYQMTSSHVRTTTFDYRFSEGLEPLPL